MSWWDEIGDWWKVQRLARKLQDNRSLLQQMLERQDYVGRLVPAIRRNGANFAHDLKEALNEILGPTALLVSTNVSLDSEEKLLRLVEIARPGGGEAYFPLEGNGAVTLVITRKREGRPFFRIEVQNPDGRCEPKELRATAEEIALRIRNASGLQLEEIPVIYLDEEPGESG